MDKTLEMYKGENMITWLKRYNDAKPQTKFYVLNGLVYGLAIIITTAYCYGRLDFVRSYPAQATIKHEKQQTEQITPQPSSNPKQ